ncbi:MAG: hypothetical protein ACFCU5_14245 [Pleurocapsa sp.]
MTRINPILNIIHAIADLLVTPIVWYQIALMVLLVFVGILLNIVAYQWMRVSGIRHKMTSLAN